MEKPVLNQTLPVFFRLTYLFIQLLILISFFDEAKSQKTGPNQNPKREQSDFESIKNDAQLQFDNGNLAGAIGVINRSLEKASALRNDSVVTDLYIMGKLFLLQMRRPAEELEFHLNAIQLAENSKMRIWKANICNNVGNLFIRQNDLYKALENFNIAKQIYLEENELKDLSMV